MSDLKKTTVDDAITIALMKYRQIYPEGVIPPEVEDETVLSAQPGIDVHKISITFSINESPHPVVFFRV